MLTGFGTVTPVVKSVVAEMLRPWIGSFSTCSRSNFPPTTAFSVWSTAVVAVTSTDSGETADLERRIDAGRLAGRESTAIVTVLKPCNSILTE